MKNTLLLCCSIAFLVHTEHTGTYGATKSLRSLLLFHAVMLFLQMWIIEGKFMLMLAKVKIGRRIYFPLLGCKKNKQTATYWEVRCIYSCVWCGQNGSQTNNWCGLTQLITNASWIFMRFGDIRFISDYPKRILMPGVKVSGAEGVSIKYLWPQQNQQNPSLWLIWPSCPEMSVLSIHFIDPPTEWKSLSCEQPFA